MKIFAKTITSLALLATPIIVMADNAPVQANYPNNRFPLVQKPYIELPLGSVKAGGWLKEMLERQKT